jgi:hypothetical protein
MEKQFIGRVEVKTTKFGELIKISFNGKDRKLLDESQNKGGYNNLLLKKGQKGNYYLEIDTWQPNQDQWQERADDLPF